jgi:hypothetical protein
LASNNTTPNIKPRNGSENVFLWLCEDYGVARIPSAALKYSTAKLIVSKLIKS